jgi:uncharacterized protein YgbK (DUF1537 family)
LDDDPTGTQTVHDIAVVTQWDPDTLRAEFARKAPGFYVLTNSRALSSEAARVLNRDVARNLQAAALESGTRYTLASRSDSTLRGHYPLEIDALAEVSGAFDVTIVAPYFEAGGRYTIADTHYVAEGDRLVPAAETAFAQDAVFGYRNSNLREWVGEKTAGRVRASDVISVSLEAIRAGGPDRVGEVLRNAPPRAIVVINAAAPRDIEVVALAALRAEVAGTKIVYRTAASLVAARLGIEPRPALLSASPSTGSQGGGLIVAGSYVPKTTEQLARLRAAQAVEVVELSVADILDASRRASAIAEASAATNAALAAGRNTLLMTSRRLVTAESAERNLAIGELVSNALISVVRGLSMPPRFLIAKGGITSSDIATRGLGVRRALVIGQLLPGVPVWRLGPESKFPGLNYVVFPGNVGNADALVEAVARVDGERARTSGG